MATFGKPTVARKRTIGNVLVGTFIGICFASMGIGVYLAWTTSNVAWLLLILPIVLFLT